MSKTPSVALHTGDIPLLIQAYQKAKAEGAETFIFNGGELLTTYAKYLIEFMTGINPDELNPKP